MFIGQILSGNWDTGWLEITGMPKDFVLSARKLVVMEEKEYHELVSDICKWKNAYEEDDIRTNGLCEKVQRLTAENKAKDEKARLFHLEVQEAILEVQEAIEALIGCEDDKSLKGESK